MKRFVECLTKKYIEKPAVPLGRWNIDYCTQKINYKVDLSNEDHCGLCEQYGQYILSNINNKKTSSLNEKEIKE